MDLHRVIELFRKSFTSSLTGEEGEELKGILDDDSLKKAYEQLSDETFLVEKFREFDEYEYKPAFNKLKGYHRQRRNRRLIAWTSSVAAAIILAFVLVYKGEQNIEPVKEQVAAQHIIPPGNKTAMLKLADGRMVPIGSESLEIEETGGSVLKYEEGYLSYSSEVATSEELYNELEVPVGGECHVCLDDGTEIWLNADSKLKYPVRFNGDTRHVELYGEAYFDVKKDSRPFVVKTETGDITVLGTSFGIRAYKGQEGYTTLVSGKVRFTSRNNEDMLLAPGEQAVVHISGVLEKRTVDVEEYVGWKDGLFVFKNRTLGAIMDIWGRWYGVEAVFQDDSLRDLEYTGSLERYDNINTFLQLLERLKDVHYDIKGHTVILFK